MSDEARRVLYAKFDVDGGKLPANDGHGFGR